MLQDVTVSSEFTFPAPQLNFMVIGYRMLPLILAVHAVLPGKMID
jgi:hypothetical protein